MVKVSQMFLNRIASSYVVLLLRNYDPILTNVRNPALLKRTNQAP